MYILYSRSISILVILNYMNVIYIFSRKKMMDIVTVLLIPWTEYQMAAVAVEEVDSHFLISTETSIELLFYKLSSKI